MGVRIYTREKDGATVYASVYYGPDGTRKVRKVKTVPKDAPKRDHERAELAARKAAQDERVKVENGEWRDPKEETAGPGFTFGKLVKTFLKRYQSRNGSMTFYFERSKVWLRLIPEGRPLAALTVRDVEAFRKARTEEVSPTTVRHDLVALSTMFRWAKARRMITENPADPDLVRRPPKARPRPLPYSEGEIVAILGKAVPWLRPLVEFGLETGADRAEILALNWSTHVDGERKVLRLPRAKTGVDRALPYDRKATIKRVLQEASDVRHDSGTVFLREGQPIDLEAAKTGLRRALKRAGLPGREKPWKSLRATFATRQAEAGLDVPTIAALMGHTTSHILEHYIKPSGSHLAAVFVDKPAKVVPITKRRGKRAKTAPQPAPGTAQRISGAR